MLTKLNTMKPVNLFNYYTGGQIHKIKIDCGSYCSLII